MRALAPLIAILAACASAGGAADDVVAIDAAAADGPDAAPADARLDAPIDAAIDAAGPIQRIGHTTPLGGSSSHAPDILLGEQIVVPSAVTLRQFGVLVIAGGPQVKLALYTDVAGAPADLIAQTTATTLVAGTLEIPPTATVIVPAGTYWIVGVYNVTASIGYTTAAASNVVKHRPLSFASPMPAIFGATSTYTGQSFNYYLVVQ